MEIEFDKYINYTAAGTRKILMLFVIVSITKARFLHSSNDKQNIPHCRNNCKLKYEGRRHNR